MTTVEDYITTNLDAYRQLEDTLGREFTHEQRRHIARYALDGMDFYMAFDKATSVTAHITLASNDHEDDFVQLLDTDGEPIEKKVGPNIVEDGVYVTPSHDAEQYENAAHEWLEDMPGIWVITNWA